MIIEEQSWHDLVTALLLCFKAEAKPTKPPSVDKNNNLSLYACKKTKQKKKPLTLPGLKKALKTSLSSADCETGWLIDEGTERQTEPAELEHTL